MTEDLEEVKERLEQLERYVNILESRVDVQESRMRFYAAAGREPTVLLNGSDGQDGAQDAEVTLTGGDDPQLNGLDLLLQSILTKQGFHNTDLRTAVRGQERLQSSIDRAIGTLNSIMQILPDIHRKVQTLADKREAR